MAITDDFTHNELTEMFTFLDAVRASGSVNMFGAGPCLEAEYGLDAALARAVLGGWMRTFDSDAQAAERVDQLMQAS